MQNTPRRRLLVSFCPASKWTVHLSHAAAVWIALPERECRATDWSVSVSRISLAWLSAARSSPPRSYPSNPPSPLASVRRRPPGSARNGGSSELGLTCSRPGKEALPVSRELIACPFSADSSFIRWVPSDSIFCSWVADTPFRPVYRGFACFLHGQASNSSLFSLKYLVV
jgi:hypothetical protein